MSTNNPMTQEQLDEIKARADSVTTLRRARRLPALRLSDDASTLIAEVKHLRALTTVDEAMVERAIRKQWGSRYWDDMLASDNDYDIALVQTYRDEMRDVLNAALAPQEEA